MGINEGIGRENLIDQIVQITGKTRQYYQAMSPYELAMELKIAKLQAMLWYQTIYDREYVCDECLKQWESRSEEPMTFCPYCQSDEKPRIIGKWRAYD